MGRENIKFKVRIDCRTYNHKNFILDALNGFCIQKTDFPFVCTLFEDASTDGTKDIIYAYLTENFDFNDKYYYKEETEEYSLIFARHKTNQNCYFATFFLKQNYYRQKKSKLPLLKEEWTQSPYFAICEGDDYWIYSLKLQKQYDFMESHPEFSITFHNTTIINETNVPFVMPLLEEREYTTDEVFSNWIVPTASLMIRKEALNMYHDQKLINGDIWIILSALNIGKGFAFKDSMSIYRRHENGITLLRHKNRGPNHHYSYINHYKFLKESFPKLSKKAYRLKLAPLYFDFIFKRDEKLLSRFKALLISLYYDPRMFFKRSFSLLS